MSTFRRYLIYFSCIGAIIVSIALVLIMQDRELLKLSFIAFFIFIIMIFDFLMALVFTDMASIINIKINDSSDELMSRIEDLSMKRCNRKVKNCQDNKIYYSMKGKLNSWLTNPIVIEKCDGYVIASVPSGYSGYFRKIA